MSTLAINYRNQLGRLVTEILIFDGALVTQGHGTYLGTGGNPAGVASSLIDRPANSAVLAIRAAGR